MLIPAHMLVLALGSVWAAGFTMIVIGQVARSG